MRFISTKTHAVNDYIFGALLIAVPLLYAEEGGPAVWVPVIIGAVLLLQSLLTNYELSIANLIPMKMHLGGDAVAGIILAASPWLFGFADRVWVPHLVVGLIEIGLALTTHVHRDQPAHYPSRSRATSAT